MCSPRLHPHSVGTTDNDRGVVKERGREVLELGKSEYGRRTDMEGVKVR